MVAQPEAQPLQQVWKKAVEEYSAQLRKAGRTEDLGKWKDVKDIDDLVDRLKDQDASFAEDVSRGSKVTHALKMGFAPVTLLMNTLGGPASAAFAPCSQIFGAVAVLITAAKKTGAAFDDIAGLFNDLSKSTQMIKPLTKRKPPPQLEQIIQGILVSLLTVCALATKRTYHVPEKSKHRSFGQVLSGVKSNVGQFGRQLLLGEDAEINAAKGNLDSLSKYQAQMVGVLTLEKVGDIQEDMSRLGAVAVDTKDSTTRMESVVVEINGLSLEIASAVVELQAGVAGFNIRLDSIGEVLSRVDFKLDDIRENMVTKDDQRELAAMLKEGFDRLQKPAKGAATSGKVEKPSLSKTAVLHSKRLQQLKATLKPQPANRSSYKRIADGEIIPGTGDWILQRQELLDWLGGKQAVLCLSGKTGIGMTFLAARIVKHILTTYPQGVQNPSAISLGYFFARSALKELRSVQNLLCTTAYQIAQNDRVYAGYIDVKVKDLDMEDCDIKSLWQTLFLDYFGESRGTTYLVVDALDECEEDEIEAFLDALKRTHSEPSKEWPSDLRLLLLHNARLVDEVKSTFEDVALYMAIDKSDTMEDITKAVDKKMAAAWGQKLVTATLYNEVHDAVLCAPQTNFVWSCLVVDDLTSIGREDVIRTRLQNLPSDVDAAMSLLLSRLSHRLDEFATEDLNDVVAWVECSHVFLSMSTLDAILTLRKPSGARIINLDDLLTQEFAGLFITSVDEDSSALPPENRVRQRLQEERHMHDEIMSVADAMTADGTEAGGDNGAPNPTPETSTDPTSAFDRKIDAWSKVTIRLTHRLVKQYIQERTIGNDLKLTTDHMHVDVLIGCLRIVCEPHSTQDKQIVDRAGGYCAVYLPEHLSDVSPRSVDVETVQLVVNYLLRLLREDEVIYRWISYADTYMNQDLLQNSEFQDSVLSWFRAAGELSPADRSWVSKVLEGHDLAMFEPLARCLTSRWLDTDEEELSSWVVFVTQWLEKAAEMGLPVQDSKTDPETYGLEGMALQVLQTARWTGMPETAHFFQRIGDTLRDEQFELQEGASRMYLRGIELDPTVSRLHAGLARTWQMTISTERIRQAIPCMVRAVELCQHDAEHWTDDADLSNQILLTECRFYLAMYYKWTADADLSDQTFGRLLENWESASPDYWDKAPMSSIYRLEGLRSRDQFDAAASMLKRIVAHPLARSPTLHVVYTHFISEPTALLEVAYKTGNFEQLNSFWINAMYNCAQFGDDGEVSAVRYHRALTILTLCPARADEAITELRKILTDVEVARPSNEFHWVKERAERQLARIYFQRALEARDEDRWPQVGVNIDSLVRLCRTDPDAEQAEIVDRECSSILAAWNRLNGQRSRAMQCARPKLEHGINILTDADPANDIVGWQAFGDACLAVGDVDRAAAAIGMQKQLCHFGYSAIEGVTEETPPEIEDAGVGDDGSDGSEGDGNESDSSEEGAIGSKDDLETEVNDPEPTTADSGTNPETGLFVNGDTSSVNLEEEEATTGADNPDNEPTGTSTKTECTATSIEVQLPTPEPSQADERKDETEASNEQHDSEVDAEDTEENDEEDEDDVLAYTCDGPCFKELPNKDVFYRCSYCISDFCQACHDMITNNTMEGFSVCSKLHERHEMPALRQKFEPGCLEMNGQSISIVDWLKGLKQAWGLPVA